MAGGLLLTRPVRFCALLFAVFSVGLASASAASAYLAAPETGPCAGVAAPSGQTGGYYWVGSDNSCTSKYVNSSGAQTLQNEEVAAGDEATGTSVPADIPSADAASGTSFWDSLVNGTSPLKSGAMDFLSGIGDWQAFSYLGTAVPLLGVTAAIGFVGWHIYNEISDVQDPQSTTTGSDSQWVATSPRRVSRRTARQRGIRS